jgi:hypothetical protein
MGGVEGLLLHEQVIEKVIVSYPPSCFVIEVLNIVALNGLLLCDVSILIVECGKFLCKEIMRVQGIMHNLSKHGKHRLAKMESL